MKMSAIKKDLRWHLKALFVKGYQLQVVEIFTPKVYLPVGGTEEQKIVPLSSKPCVISWPITMPMPP